MSQKHKKLSEKSCQACLEETAPLKRSGINMYLNELPDWTVTQDDKVLFKNYQLKNFESAVQVVNRISNIAEQEGHHPDLHITNYKHLKIELSTHAVSGLTENDFIMASKIKEIPELKT